MSASALHDRCAALVEELGLGAAGDIAEVTPLTGGVASDIVLIRLGDREICAKFALPKLKTAEDWHAPVHRNAAEYAWLTTAARIVPECAIQLYGHSATLHGFAMAYISGGDVYLWKTAMLEGKPPDGEAARVGDLVGRIHAASVDTAFDTAPFRNRDDFHALRIEPYLRFTAAHTPALAPALNRLAEALYRSDQVLVHGDVSPKNILMRGSGPVLLDAECATMGDASFDPAFCLNHLVLKALHLPDLRVALLKSVRDFWDAYAAYVDWETPEAVEARVAALLPALMLARIDGKSPVEYLNAEERDAVRALSQPLIAEPARTIGGFIERLTAGMKEQGT